MASFVLPTLALTETYATLAQELVEITLKYMLQT